MGALVLAVALAPVNELDKELLKVWKFQLAKVQTFFCRRSTIYLFVNFRYTVPNILI